MEYSSSNNLAGYVAHGNESVASVLKQFKGAKGFERNIQYELSTQ